MLPGKSSKLDSQNATMWHRCQAFFKKNNQIVYVYDCNPKGAYQGRFY